MDKWRVDHVMKNSFNKSLENKNWLISKYIKKILRKYACEKFSYNIRHCEVEQRSKKYQEERKEYEKKAGRK